MAAEPTTRFAHLLQPIRDLSKVWKIEIAEELEKYIEEVAQLLVTSPDDGVSQLNFAEAALLIQGSTAIYSRKVELLYQLVYQALDLLCLNKGKDASRRGKVVQSGLWAPIPETDELLTIDHLIKEGRNILLDHSAPLHRQDTQRRVPLFLLPRDSAHRGKHEFRISSCTVHHTGVYLLQESDAALLDDIMADQPPLETTGPAGGPLVPAPPMEVQDLDNRLQALLRELPGDAAPTGGGLDLEGPAPLSPPPGLGGGDAMARETPAKAPRGFGGLAVAGMEPRPAVPVKQDPWAMLDEHATVGTDMPLEVGRTCKRVNAKKLLMNAEGLPDTSALDLLSDAELWSSSNSATGVAPMLTAGHPVESLFLAVAGSLKSGPRYETQRAGFSTAWLEFEDLFSQAASVRRQLKACIRRPGAPPTPHGSDDEGASDVECGPPPPMHTFGTPTAAKGSGAGFDGLGMTPIADTELSEDQLRQQEQRREVAMLENMIQDAQVKYESTIRQHLAALQKDGASDDQRFPQLYANVRRWQDQLEPVLKEFESRPDFNIHTYSKKFLDKMSNIQQDSGSMDRTVKFSRLVHNQPRWEVCRRFLTCLILTNHGNTDIVFNGEEERINNFSIQLLKAEAKMISFDGEQAGAASEAASERGRGKKKTAAAPLEVAAEAAPPARKRAKKSTA